MDLGAEETESVQIGDWDGLSGQFLVRFAQFVLTVCVGAVASVLTLLLLLEVLANLRLVVVVWNVKHFVLYFNRKLLLTNSQMDDTSKAG